MKKHIDISLQGTFSTKRTYRFEVYREASNLRIKGYVQFTSPSEMWIATEGEEEVVDKFQDWCKRNFSSEEVVMRVVKPGNIMNYNEF
ncbi:MAG: acylphosphatase, partial [bacterium]